METILWNIAVLLLVASADSDTRRHKVKSNLRILHGNDVPDDQFGYVVQIASIKNNLITRKCTATLVSDTFSLTAAHCTDSFVNAEEFKDIYIWYRQFTTSPLITKFYASIIRIHIHPHYIYSYNNDMIDMNDISLVKSQSVGLKQYGRLSAIDFSAMFGMTVTFIGGGPMTMDWNYRTNEWKKLQMGTGVVIKCDPRFMEKIAYPLICVAPRCDKKAIAWYGDSGAPILHDDKVLGVLATITGTDITAYVPVSPYLDWIYHLVRSKPVPGSRRDSFKTHINEETKF